MKKVSIFLIIGLILAVGSGIAYAGEKAPQGVVDLANSTLAKFGTDPIIVSNSESRKCKGEDS